MTQTAPPPAPDLRAARTAGLLYASLAITGVLGFLIVRPRLYDEGDPATTTAQLTGESTLAGALITLELGIVLTQALVAWWFFRLFRPVDPVATGAVFAFGLVNATAILTSAALLTTARGVADGSVPAPGGDAEATVQGAFALSDSLWKVAAVFFGLWLIPLGLLVLRSGWMPAPLGWVLVAGGVGYTLSALAAPLFPDPVGTVLTLPANVGEFWMVGYLIVCGARRTASTGAATRHDRP